ncbi:MAG: acyl-CoA dehydrogenase [Hydrocarboniphaga sp.]|uniref:acyl-CoA dehydrogenase family protein n=1 Tax=Hydrocarboniphaga sp. TaxID=2033016 RepID=UPI00262DF5BD|nr:acyl-CoA dehydrogenase family protein [Hydrocarboniphaga sp.]MDB5970015.1 acyl-CoA dehydrogenase [Hydrocarboniphaga sp.]
MSVEMDETEVEDVVENLLGFVDAVVLPLEKEHAKLLDDPRLHYDERGAYSPELKKLKREVRQQSAEAGYYNMFVPESIGGGDFGAYMLYRVWDALYHRYGPARLLPYASVAHWSYGPSLLCSYLTPQISEQLLQPLMAGQITSCFAMSEPDAGSDALAMRTRAVRDGDDWLITGTKQWITNSPVADWVFVWAVTDEELRRTRKGGVSCFALPVTTPGFQVDSVLKLFGHIGGDEGILSFRDVRVPSTALVGELNQGFKLAMAGVNTGRMYNAGRCIGLSKWALDKASEYAGTRKTFGKTIDQYQGVSFQLADSAIEIYAAESMTRDCARRLERGESVNDQVAMVKVYTTELGTRVYDRCMQVHGGMGLTNELKLYEGWQQSRIVRIADGSAEIMRRNIAASLARR